MHHMILVIGDDVEPQMNALMVENEHGWSWCDWWAIGGRYAGTLPLRNGAEGRTFGTARPAMEDWMMEHGARVGTLHWTGGGVDQALAGDIDLDQVTAYAIVANGHVALDCEGTISPESNATMMAAALAQQIMERGDTPPFPLPSEEDLARCMAENDAWNAQAREYLRGLPPDAMLTVVDAHS
jgi:hypothetical protein